MTAKKKVLTAKKKVLLALGGAVTLFVLFILLVVIPAVKRYLNIVTSPSQFISTSLSLAEVDEEFIEEYNPKSQRGFDALHYELRIELFPSEKKIKGDAAIKIKINNKKESRLELNFYDNLKISSLLLNGQKVKFSRSEKNLVVELPAGISDTSIVRVIYEGEPKSLGFGSFEFDESYTKPLIYTLSEPVFASTWFPCIDLPDDKATAELFITNDSSYVSVANGVLKSIIVNGKKKTYHWFTRYPISTYLIAFYSGEYIIYSDKYVTISQDTLALNYYITSEKYEDALRDFSDHKTYLKIFEELFGPYPFAGEKYGIAEFGWDLGAMEHQTITGVGTQYISGLKLFQDMFIHELAHHWWGNAVGLKSWKDIWLNEGFSTYSEALYWEKRSGFEALQSTLRPKFGSFGTGTLYNPEINMFIKMVYDKGAWVLHMLRKEMGNENFFRTLREYYETFKYKNASTEDFKKLCERIAGKKLDYFFEQWVYKGIGIIEADYEYGIAHASNLYRLEVKINQTQKKYPVYIFPLDLKIYFEGGEEPEIKTVYVNKKQEIFNFTFAKKPVKVEPDPDKWLLAVFNSRGE